MCKINRTNLSEEDIVRKICLRQNFEFEDSSLVNFVNLNDEERGMVRNWRNREEIRKWMRSNHIISKKEHSRFIEDLNNDSRNFYWLAKGRNKEYLGIIYLNKLDLKNKNAYLGIYANPDNEIKQKGRMLIELLLRLSFEYANLGTLKLEVLEDNTTAIDFYNRIGFEREGVLKEFVFRDGRWKDAVIMRIINDKKDRKV